MSTSTAIIKPYRGRVMLTDRPPYSGASDHNMVDASYTLGEATSARVGTFNVRRSDLDKGTYAWLNRRAKAAQLISDSGVSVLALQECRLDQWTYLLGRLKALTGVTWAGWRPSNVALMWKADRWTRVSDETRLMDNGAELDRRVAMVALRSKRTGHAFWFGSTHFGVGLPLAVWRRHQAAKVCELLRKMPRAASEAKLEPELFGDVRRRSVIMGDFNDYAHHTTTGVRKVFFEAGFLDQRELLSNEAFAGDRWRTNHGFGKATPADGRQIDAIFTYA